MCVCVCVCAVMGMTLGNVMYRCSNDSLNFEQSSILLVASYGMRKDRHLRVSGKTAVQVHKMRKCAVFAAMRLKQLITKLSDSGFGKDIIYHSYLKAYGSREENRRTMNQLSTSSTFHHHHIPRPGPFIPMTSSKNQYPISTFVTSSTKCFSLLVRENHRYHGMTYVLIVWPM